MTIRNIAAIIRKDLTTGPRGMMFVWILAFPLIMTFVIRLVFGGLIDPSPRLGIVDLGSSAVPEAARSIEGITVRILYSAEELREMVLENRLDAGIVIEPGFDDAIVAGLSPDLELMISGGSLASNRIVIAVAVIDLIRGVAGEPAPVEVVTRIVGDGSSVPIGERLIPILVLFAVSMAGVFLPAASIIQEKESRTLEGILVTPARIGDFMTAKGVVGFVLAIVIGVITLFLNMGSGARVMANLAIITTAAFMCVPLGLIIGAAVKNMTMMFSIWKSGAIVLFAPAILFLFPGVPRWVAMLFPTYYFLGPLYDVNIEAAALGDVIIELGIAVVMSAALVAAAGLAARRLERKLGEA